MNNLRTIAVLAHTAAIEEIAEIQERMTQREATLRLHGAKTLPLQRMLRKIAARQQVLSDAHRLMEMEVNSDTRRLAELYAVVKDLELVFQEYYAQNDLQFARAMAEYFRNKE